MSCSCNCNPCRCTPSCDTTNEPISSALNNFILSFFGTVTKTCVNGQVVWALPCNLEAGSSLLPRTAGEGVACYLLRLFDFLQGGTCLDFRQIFINGICYTTWQSAYDANIGATTPTLMLVGDGEFGDLNITANYNSNIIIFGLGDGASRLGNVTTNRFNFILEGHKVAINSIDTRIAGVGGAIVTLSGGASVGAINNSRTTASGVAGSITATNWQIASIDTSVSVLLAAGGAVVLSRCICGPINTSAIGELPGPVTLRHCTSVGTITNSGPGGTGSNFVIAEETNIIGTAGSFAIAEITATSSFINSKIKTVTSVLNAIAEVNQNGAQFLNTIIVPGAAGLPIAASLPRTIIAYNLLTRNALSPNVTLSEGNTTSSPNIRYP